MNTKVPQPICQIFIRTGLITAALLLIPAIAMQLTEEVNWQPLDFVFMGILLFTTLSISVLIWQKINPKHRKLAIVGVVLLFLYIWAELAVGIFTDLGS